MKNLINRLSRLEAARASQQLFAPDEDISPEQVRRRVEHHLEMVELHGDEKWERMRRQQRLNSDDPAEVRLQQKLDYMSQ